MAKWLLPGNMAVHQTQIAGMPPEIFPVELRIIYGDILHLPESILCGDYSIVDFCIPHILEHIFAVALKTVDIDSFAEHERVSASMELQIPDPDVMASPEDLVRIIHDHIVDLDIEHLAEHLRGIDDSVGHLQAVRIPESRTAPDREITFVDGEPVNMPERIVPLKTAVRGNDIAAFLDCRLSFQNGHIVEMQVM